MVRAMGASATISEPTTCCRWGDIVKANGTGLTFSGMIGDLQRGMTDIGWANLFVNYERTKVMDYTVTYRTDLACFLVCS